MIIAQLDMFPTLAMLVGGQDAFLGGCVYLVISVGIGVLFAVLVPDTMLRYLLPAGVIYGVIWWLIVPVVLTPAWLIKGANSVVVQFTLMSLAGQAIHGPVNATALYWLRRVTGP